MQSFFKFDLVRSSSSLFIDPHGLFLESNRNSCLTQTAIGDYGVTVDEQTDVTFKIFAHASGHYLSAIGFMANLPNTEVPEGLFPENSTESIGFYNNGSVHWNLYGKKPSHGIVWKGGDFVSIVLSKYTLQLFRNNECILTHEIENRNKPLILYPAVAVCGRPQSIWQNGISICSTQIIQ